MRIAAVLDWPVRDGLLAFLDRLRARAEAAYAVHLQLWAALAPHTKDPLDQPEPPPILAPRPD